MPRSNDLELVKAALSHLSSKAPEIRQSVLACLVHSQYLVIKDITHVVVHSYPLRKHLLVTFQCEADDFAQHFSPGLATEYWELRLLTWLKSETLFMTPFDFYMSHYILANNSYSALPPIDHVPKSLKTEYPLDVLRRKTPILIAHGLLQQTSRFPNLPPHGLERIVLDFDASEYFSLFDVRVPPFDNTSTHKDEHLIGAATLLQHCKELTIIFGKTYRSANPWSYLASDQWNSDATQRTNVCHLGDIVDWIFEYAWANGYIQHIPKIHIKGPVQPWVREKWENIFATFQSAKQKNSDVKWRDIHDPDIEAIETRGQVWGHLWIPKIEYPPECKCAKGCSELESEVDWGVAEDESPLLSWDEFKEKIVGSMDWDELRDEYGELED